MFVGLFRRFEVTCGGVIGERGGDAAAPMGVREHGRQNFASGHQIHSLRVAVVGNDRHSFDAFGAQSFQHAVCDRVVGAVHSGNFVAITGQERRHDLVRLLRVPIRRLLVKQLDIRVVLQCVLQTVEPLDRGIVRSDAAEVDDAAFASHRIKKNPRGLFGRSFVRPRHVAHVVVAEVPWMQVVGFVPKRRDICARLDASLDHRPGVRRVVGVDRQCKVPVRLGQERLHVGKGFL